ncbi:hypothetical protein SAMN04487969_11936 [Paenibacillus algorifonticola]|uniref:Uncharacterized protein n=1 Tax=Paenibacillus algorifonticola TaxID=684063 RepID=A0A1I2H1I1_9BACL|nr:hypothetical protein [Paenibacillus algorifonticola]SFF22666.1 hypothetical protein SAMN04487969_11936 [Paenibacillus algorifonticola]
MGYAEFQPKVTKVNLKPGGVVEVILTTALSDLRGSIETLSEMIDQKVRLSMESTVVTYNVQINARTEKPIRSYKVDESGIVSEIKPEGEQMKLDLGVTDPKEKLKDVPTEIGREVVDAFILSGLAPEYEGNRWYPVKEWIERFNASETYLRIASDAGLSSGRLIEIIDGYRQHVAPLAAKWDEWRQSRLGDDPEDDLDEEQQDESQEEPSSEQQDGASESDGKGEQPVTVQEQGKGQQPDQPSSNAEGAGKETETPSSDSGASTPKGTLPITGDDLDQYILKAKPSFPDILFDFPTLLARRKNGETWLKIAASLGIQSSQLSTAWGKYKKLVQQQLENGAA